TVLSEDLLSMAVYFYGPPHAAASHVEWRNDKAAVLVHPAGTRPMVALIQNVEVDAVRRVTARVHLDHPEGATTEFAILAVPQVPEASQSSMRKVLNLISGRIDRNREQLAEKLAKKAKWLSLEANEYGEVLFQFAEPYS